MAALTTQTVTLAGPLITFAAATVTTGDTFVADDRTSLWVKNASGGSVNATITHGPKGVAGLTVGPMVIACSNAGSGLTPIGPFGQSEWNDPVAGNVTVVFSAVTSITIAAVRQ